MSGVRAVRGRARRAALERDPAEARRTATALRPRRVKVEAVVFDVAKFLLLAPPRTRTRSKSCSRTSEIGSIRRLPGSASSASDGAFSRARCSRRTSATPSQLKRIRSAPLLALTPPQKSRCASTSLYPSRAPSAVRILAASNRASPSTRYLRRCSRARRRASLSRGAQAVGGVPGVEAQSEIPRVRSSSAASASDHAHAMHLVRLMRTGLEVLVSGELSVRRDDAAELLAIRDGGLSFEELEALARTARARNAGGSDGDRASGRRLTATSWKRSRSRRSWRLTRLAEP